MKNDSFRQKLLTSFLAIGILPLLICTLLMLNIFRLSLTRSAADAAETQLDAMSGELSGLLSDCETVMEKLCAEPGGGGGAGPLRAGRAARLLRFVPRGRAVLSGASLSVYGADGRQLYSTSSQPASGSLSPRWGLLAAAADGGVVYRGASSKSSACIQAVCAVRRGSVPLGYVVADVTAAQLTALFDGSTPPPAAFCCWTPSGIRCTPRPTSPPRRCRPPAQPASGRTGPLRQPRRL